MKAKIKVDILGGKELEREFERQLAKEAGVKREILRTALDIQTQAKDNVRALAVIDTGLVRDSIIVETSRGGLQAEIGPTAPYAPYLEFGTRPHFPPVQPLEEWGHRHGEDNIGYLIARGIARRGTQARPYLYPAFFSLEGEFEARLKRVMETS